MTKAAGDNVKRLRQDRDISQERLARMADVSTGTIRNLEAGNGSTVSTIVKVARALGVRPVDLFPKDEPVKAD